MSAPTAIVGPKTPRSATPLGAASRIRISPARCWTNCRPIGILAKSSALATESRGVNAWPLPRAWRTACFEPIICPKWSTGIASILDARINYSSDKIAFLTNDTEHHRIALVALEPYAPKGPGVSVGFYHAAFAYADLDEGNPIGITVVPEELIEQRAAGVPDSVVLRRADIP
jgi:hypothetical protein